MFLAPFHQVQDNQVRINAHQASRFAKQIAGDFNPLHDPDASRFCVPGDLLFSLVLARYGLSQNMHFTFNGMVGDEVPLLFPPSDASRLEIQDQQGKTYLTVERAGDSSHDEALITALTRDYVAFSGRNFPHILVPLMAEQGVMINPDRPMVIYQSMSFELDHLDFTEPHLTLAGTDLEVKGKRGSAQLHFEIRANDQPVGRGFKQLILSGLRDYDEPRMQAMVDIYEARKADYLAAD